MSTLLTRRRAPRQRRPKPRDPAEQAPLFGAAPATTEPRAAAAAPEPSATASVSHQGPTLEELVAGAWDGVLAGASVACLVCGSPMTPRQSAGAGVVGGRCGGCASTLA